MADPEYKKAAWSALGAFIQAKPELVGAFHVLRLIGSEGVGMRLREEPGRLIIELEDGHAALTIDATPFLPPGEPI